MGLSEPGTGTVLWLLRVHAVLMKCREMEVAHWLDPSQWRGSAPSKPIHLPHPHSHQIWARYGKEGTEKGNVFLAVNGSLGKLGFKIQVLWLLV